MTDRTPVRREGAEVRGEQRLRRTTRVPSHGKVTESSPPARTSASSGGRHRRRRAVGSRLRVGHPLFAAMLSNAAALASATIATSILGIAYWLVAAHSFTQTAVGFASAAVSGMTLVATLASLGFSTFALGEAHRDLDRRAGRVAAAVVASAAAAAVFAVIYLALVPLVARQLAPISSSILNACVFVVSAVATGATMVLDQSLVGALRGGTQLSRNLILEWASSDFYAQSPLSLRATRDLLCSPRGWSVCYSLLLRLQFIGVDGPWSYVLRSYERVSSP